MDNGVRGSPGCRGLGWRYPDQLAIGKKMVPLDPKAKTGDILTTREGTGHKGEQPAVDKSNIDDGS